MAVNFTVIDTRQVPSTEPGRLGKLDWWVTYQLDPLHTYTMTVSQDRLTDEVIKDAVRKHIG